MSLTLIPQPWMQSEAAKRIMSCLNNDQGSARFVGGCVRDAWLQKPVNDIDITTSHLPEKAMELLEAANIKVKPTGLKHGTVTAIIDGQGFEITTLRKDTACHGRHADVEFSDDYEEDAHRRDFTMNALSCTIEGEVFDYFGGVEDLANQDVRFVGDAYDRVQEDYLRILRFFRFSAYYASPPMDEEALGACKKFAQNILLLSGERIHNEMMKLLTAPDPAYVFAMMKEYDILEPIFSFNVSVTALKRLVHIEQKVNCPPNPLVRCAVLLQTSHVAEESFTSFAKHWRLSNKEISQLHQLLFSDMVYPLMTRQEQQAYIRKYSNLSFVYAIILSWAQQLPTDSDTAYKEMLRFATSWKAPTFPVQGQDILDLGIEAGEQVGKLLKQAEQWWEAEEYTPTKEAIIKYIRKLR